MTQVCVCVCVICRRLPQLIPVNHPMETVLLKRLRRRQAEGELAILNIYLNSPARQGMRGPPHKKLMSHTSWFHECFCIMSTATSALNTHTHFWFVPNEVGREQNVPTCPAQTINRVNHVSYAAARRSRLDVTHAAHPSPSETFFACQHIWMFFNCTEALNYSKPT